MESDNKTTKIKLQQAQQELLLSDFEQLINHLPITLVKEYWPQSSIKKLR